MSNVTNFRKQLESQYPEYRLSEFEADQIETLETIELRRSSGDEEREREE